jgi:oxygen-independent coproporphyrinogen-3 oxidase
VESAAAQPRLGLYLHVPFCASRCGYCDFNTYTAEELGSGVRRDTFADTLTAELDLAAGALGDRPVDTVFIGGGTPTLLGLEGLTRLMGGVRARFSLAPNAEVTCEANPDSVDAGLLAGLLDAGITRMSFGMQSSAPHVLAVLDRTHTPGASVAAARAARDVGFAHVNLDLIYGTPGESDDDVRRSLDDVLASGVDHVSAYALIVEPATPLARRVRSGVLPAPDDDDCARRYELIDDVLGSAGMPWYEVSNWAAPGAACRHNLGYWNGDDWWGVGPGAHSHVSGRRWWNVKHPSTYARCLAEGESPIEGAEDLTAEQRVTERIMLALRMADGLPVDDIPVETQGALGRLEDAGLVLVGREGHVLLTRRGRLLADSVIRELVP